MVCLSKIAADSCKISDFAKRTFWLEIIYIMQHEGAISSEDRK